MQNLSGGSLVQRKRSEAEVWLNNAEVGEKLLSLVIGDSWVDDNIISRNPVDRGCNPIPIVSIILFWATNVCIPVLVTSLERVDNTEDLGGIPTSRCWVGHDQTDSLFGINDEDGADGECNALGVDVGSVLVVQHVIEVCNLSLLVTDDWEGQVRTRDFVDILDPSLVGGDGVGGKPNELDTTLGELGLEFSKSTELSGAHRGVI